MANAKDKKKENDKIVKFMWEKYPNGFTPLDVWNESQKSACRDIAKSLAKWENEK